MSRLGTFLVFVAIILSGCHASRGATLSFQLLTWNDTQATVTLPSAVGRKPSAGMPASGDWVVFSADDAILAAPNNPAGALSHNLADLTGGGGAGFNLAPSLSGTLTLHLEPAGGSDWTVAVKALAYIGQPNAIQSMNQWLVTPSSQAATNAMFNVDGAGNAGQWTVSASNGWAIRYELDFYFATSADGDPSPTDIDAAFDNETQIGFLIPVNCLTTNGLTDIMLNDPLGYHVEDFEQYLVTEIAPRLPSEATYLLITQMAKTHPGYVEAGLPITVGSLVGNMTIAYTTQTLAAAPQPNSLRFESGLPVLRFNASIGQVCQVQQSEDLANWETVSRLIVTSSESGEGEWTDLNPAATQRFYRVIALMP